MTTRHWDFHGNPASPSRQTLVAVLAALGVAAATDEEIEASLREAETAPWRQVLPATVVARAGAQTPVVVHLPDGARYVSRSVWRTAGCVSSVRPMTGRRPARLTAS